MARHRPHLVNVCIACNQACLDHYFTDQVITALVNPRAAGKCSDAPAPMVKRVAVVGAGVAVMATALEAGRRGHHLTLLEAAPRIGGQLAANIPGNTAINAFVKYEPVHSRTLPSELLASEHSGRRLEGDEIGTALTTKRDRRYEP